MRKIQEIYRAFAILSSRRFLGFMAAIALVTACALTVRAPAASASSTAAQDSSSCANPVVCENQKQGTPQSTWDITSSSTSIEGFADPFSVNAGQPVSFKIRSQASSYAIDIYRMGYYGGDSARLIASLTPDIAASQASHCVTPTPRPA